ncbi:MAG: cupin domain-containing protein [Candidatus Latescibacterota bacterium]
MNYINLALLLFITSLSVSFAQEKPFSQLDPTPYDPKTDANIDMYISSWMESMPRHSHGSLIERDILTKGDPLNPKSRGAVMSYFNRFCHATLDARNQTSPTRLADEQEIFYFLSGRGIIKARDKTGEIFKGVAVLIPMGIEFTLTNTSDEPLTMFLINEPVPKGFIPNKDILLKDMNKVPYTSSNAHWAMNFKDVFSKGTGTSAISCILIVDFLPMTIGQPHSHGNGFQEIWTTIEGDTSFLLGKQLRKQPPGTCYMIPPDGKTPHANINVSDKPVTLFHFRRNAPEF